MSQNMSTASIVRHGPPIFKRQPAATAVAVLAAFALAGCGGGEREPLTREQLIAQADAICAEASDELDALGEPETPEELADLAAEAAAIAEDQLRRLRDLQPPAGDEDDYTAMLDLTEEQIEATRGIAEAAAAGDAEAAQARLAEVQELDDEADELAAAYGFEVCGAG
jgi:hypothetical protein